VKLRLGVLFVNFTLALLVAVNFFTGGFAKLTYYDYFLARAWVFSAFITLFIALFSLNPSKPYHLLNIILLLYGALATLLAVGIVFFGS